MRTWSGIARWLKSCWRFVQRGAGNKPDLLEDLLAAGKVRSVLLFASPLTADEAEIVRQAYAAGLAHGALAPDGSPAGAGVRPADSASASVAAGSGEE